MRVHKVAIHISRYEQVVWATREDPMKKEEFTDQELRQSGYLTNRFTEESWCDPEIQHLQRVIPLPMLATTYIIPFRFPFHLMHLATFFASTTFIMLATTCWCFGVISDSSDMAAVDILL